MLSFTVKWCHFECSTSSNSGKAPIDILIISISRYFNKNSCVKFYFFRIYEVFLRFQDFETLEYHNIILTPCRPDLLWDFNTNLHIPEKGVCCIPLMRRRSWWGSVKCTWESIKPSEQPLDIVLAEWVRVSLWLESNLVSENEKGLWSRPRMEDAGQSADSLLSVT